MNVPYTLKIRSGCEGGGKGALIQEDKSATLATNNDQYLFQPVDVDLYNQTTTGDVAISIRCRGDNEHTPCVVEEEPIYCVDQGGGKSGANVHENKAPTLCTTHGGEPAVAYGLDRASFNQGQNAKFDFSVTEEQQPTLTARGPGAVCYGIDHAITTGGNCTAQGSCVYENIQGTLKASGAHAVCYSVDEKCGNTYTWENQANTLAARDYKQPQGVAYEVEKDVVPRYIVRRLTPTECARLQGFADQWGWIEEKKTLTEEEYHFWLDVRNTHARINGKKEQDYTEKQMLTWYNKLWTDSAEYKMWGNGIALPTALYCIQGMAEMLAMASTRKAVEEEEDDSWMD